MESIAVASLLHTSVARLSSYVPRPPPSNAPWDVLYVAAGLIGFILIMVSAASYWNWRDEHRDT